MSKIYKLFVDENIKTWKKFSTKLAIILIVLALLGALSLSKLLQYIDEKNDINSERFVSSSEEGFKGEIEILKEQLQDNTLSKSEKEEIERQIKIYEIRIKNQIYRTDWRSEALSDTSIDDKTLELIASKSKGHMRNAHMLLDNYLLLGEEDFKTSLISSREALLQYLISIIKHDNELLFKSISLIETFPITNVYEDFQILLRDITRRMVEPKDDIETKIYKSMSSKYLKFLKAFSSEYIKVSFQNEISATTALMALYQQFTAQNTSNTSSNRRTVRTK